jgi:large-conductance mechanosensitive channel
MDILKIAKSVSEISDFLEEAKKSRNVMELSPALIVVETLDKILDDFTDNYLKKVIENIQQTGKFPEVEVIPEESSSKSDDELKSIDYLIKNLKIDGSS